MKSTLLSIPVQRPVAMSMFFLAMALLGLFSWFKLPIELIPSSSGEQLYVKYFRPGSDPAVIEREILIPMESRIKQLPGVTKTWGEIAGNQGTLNIEFEPGSNYRIRELELRRIAADLTRHQPTGTIIRVSSQDTSVISRFVMSVQILGGDDGNVLRDLVEERMQPTLEAVEGVSRIFVFGGASREVTVLLDASRCAELGVRMSDASAALKRSIGELHYLGSTEEVHQRISVVIDDRPGELAALGDIRISPHLPVLLSHVAEIKIASAPQKSVSRVNGQTSVSLVVFQDQGANLVQLGQRLHTKLESLRNQFKPYNVDLVVSFDASEKVEEQLGNLQRLAVSGFLIALLVLFLFLKALKAVAVVAIAVPMSLLIAGAFLYLAGYTLNLFTLFGLVIGVGMLVDNSIVVHEAVQRNMEKGLKPDVAAVQGIQRTIRAIITASATNAIVFLPIIYLQEIPLTVRLALNNIVPAILFPLAASLLVAIGLVPMLAQRLATQTPISSQQNLSGSRLSSGSAVIPQPARELFSAFLKVALRRPTLWVIGILGAILLTVIIALPWVLVQSIAQPATEADQVRIEVEFDGGGSLEAAGLVFERLEQAAMGINGVQRVESNYQEEQGSVTIFLESMDIRPKDVNAARVRRTVNAAVNGMNNIQLRPISTSGNGASNGSDSFNSQSSQVAISGPNMAQLNRLAEQIKERLNSIPQISGATVSSRKSPEEIYVETNSSSLAPHFLHSADALKALVSIGREGQRMPLGFNLANGKDIPIIIRHVEQKEAKALKVLLNLPILTEHAVLSLSELATIKRRASPLAIAHQNGRRELRVSFQLNEYAPKSGPERIALESKIGDLIQDIYRPEGYTINLIESNESTDWFKLIIIPIILLLFALLAVSFESLTMPLLILLTVPLTVIGSIWALLVAGLGIDMIAVIGVVVLLGLTVNPAILLVDRMQQMLRTSGCSGGKAAMTAVRERVRPVLMTSCTTIAGLCPLAFSQGQELAVWPPFATVVIGGLVTSTLLTLLVIPIGFVVLSKVDKIMGVLGPWKLLLWVAVTASIISPLIITGQLESFVWQVLITCAIAGFLFWILLRIFYRQPECQIDTTKMVVETRFLSKTYGQSGLIVKTWRRCVELSRKKELSNPAQLKDSILLMILLFIASMYLVSNLQTLLWQISFAYLAGGFLRRALIKIRLLYSLSFKSQQKSGDHSFFDKTITIVMPWSVLAVLVVYYILLPVFNDQPQQMHLESVVLLSIVTFVIQLGRRTATLVIDGSVPIKSRSGRFQSIRSNWRAFCLRFFALDLPKKEFTALSSLNFRAEAGLIGILGPNGAGKTTLLRLLANVLDSSVGTIYYANVERRKIGRNLARLIGYLPQEFGLPDHLTCKEYLNYFALLYQIGDRVERNNRVDQLIIEVGLEKKQNQKISTYSGGMRQRVAVARTLLQRPSVIIVDEPTAGLDPRERIRFRNLLAKLAKDRVILFSTHVIEDVAVSCDRVIVLKSGSLVFDGTPQHLSELAKDKIWQVILPKLEAQHFEKQNNVISQSVEQQGNVNLRVLAEHKPHQQAEVVGSNLEDGYFQLFNQAVPQDE